jgi:putative photosynthetic complex assembly protein 2
VTDHVIPALYVLLVWWFSTGIVLYVAGLPRRTFRWTLLVASGLLAAALHVLAASASDASATGAYVAFTAAILVWAWQEIGFLTGFVTGPRRDPCPPDIRGLRRAFHAFETIRDHEFALLALGAAVVAMTWGGENQVGPWTFALLWVMRLSSKLNLFLGVRNLNAEFLPAHLRYIGSYFTRRPMNVLYPFSVTLSTLATFVLAHWALAAAPGSFEATAFSLLAALMALAVIEHWFMMLPLHAVNIWKWSLRSRDADPPRREPTQSRFAASRLPRGASFASDRESDDVPSVPAPATPWRSP